MFNRDGKDTYPFDDWEGSVDGEALPMLAFERGRSRSHRPTRPASSSARPPTARSTRSGRRSASPPRDWCRVTSGSARWSSTSPPKGSCGLPTKLEGYELRVALSDHLIAERIIRNTVEKRILASLLSFPQRMLVMADGSLKHPLDSYPESLFSDGDSGSSLVGFSKSSALISSNKLSAVVSRAVGPAYSTVEDGTIHTLLAKFSRDGLVFRVDLARSRGTVSADARLDPLQRQLHGRIP